MKVIDQWLKLVGGTLIAALGMALINQAGLGNVILTVLWDGMSQKLPITIGLASYITSIMMILFSVVFDPKQVRLGTIVHFLLFGAFMDFFGGLLPTVTAMSHQMLVAIIGVILLSVGIGVYAHANLGRGPYEGICFAISEKWQVDLKIIRTCLDGLFAGVGFIMGGAVGLATLFNLLVSGSIIQGVIDLLDQRHLKGPRKRRKWASI